MESAYTVEFLYYPISDFIEDIKIFFSIPRKNIF